MVFDLRSLTWSSLKLKANVGKDDDDSSQEILPATSGHNMVKFCMTTLLDVHICYSMKVFSLATKEP